MLALPGGAYIYQGEELGLPEHTTLEGKYRQDPTFARTGGARVGRDGCRVPLPWEAGVGAANGDVIIGNANTANISLGASLVPTAIARSVCFASEFVFFPPSAPICPA